MSDQFLACLDVETFLIQEGRQVPPLVVYGLTTTDGEQWVITHKAEGMYRESLSSPWKALDGSVTPDGLVLEIFKRVRERKGKFVNHNLAFDMGVLGEAYPHLLPHIFQMYEDNLCECTILRERLLDIAQGQLGLDFGRLSDEGKPKKKLYNLKDLAFKYFKADLDKTTWRKGYGELYDIPFKFWEEGAKQYVIDDTEWTLALFEGQREIAGTDIPNSPEQARAAFALYLTSAWGLRTDGTRVKKYKNKLLEKMVLEEDVLIKLGVVRPRNPKTGKATKNMKAIKDLLRSVCEGLGLPPVLTDTGLEKQEKGELDDPWKYLSTSSEFIDDLLGSIKGWELEHGKEAPKEWTKIGHLSEFSHTQKLLGTFIPTLERGTKYPVNAKYQTLVETGRASCVAPWTKIPTSRGEFRIDELGSELKKGEVRVLSHLNRWRKVTDCFISSASSQMFEVKLSNGSCITCTNYHRLLTPQGWKRLSEISEGDHVCYAPENKTIVGGGLCPVLHNGGAYLDTDEGKVRCNEGQVLRFREAMAPEVRPVLERDHVQEAGGFPKSEEDSGVVTVASIVYVGDSEVWDISVQEDESYCSQGFINHNCASPNVMQLPREPGTRECFVPRPGFVYCSVDYEALELHTLAQACIELVGHSAMAKALNSGKDCHTLFATNYLIPHISYEDAMTIRKDKSNNLYSEVKRARDLAKIGNFGLGGGMGFRSFREYAKNSDAHIILSERQCKDLKAAWLKQWPEMRDYFKLMGEMLDPDTGSATATQIGSGRVRLVNRYTALCNTFFQGAGGDLAKEACFMLTKACYVDEKSPLFGSRLVAFIHDETIMEHPIADAHIRGAEQARIMIEAGKRICKDVPLKAEPCLMTFWSKEASEVWKDGKKGGVLLPWNGDFDAIVGIETASKVAA